MRCCHLRKQPNRTDRQDGIQMRFNKTLHKDVLAGNESVIGSDWQMITKTKIGSVNAQLWRTLKRLELEAFRVKVVSGMVVENVRLYKRGRKNIDVPWSENASTTTDCKRNNIGRISAGCNMDLKSGTFPWYARRAGPSWRIERVPPSDSVSCQCMQLYWNSVDFCSSRWAAPVAQWRRNCNNTVNSDYIPRSTDKCIGNEY